MNMVQTRTATTYQNLRMYLDDKDSDNGQMKTKMAQKRTRMRMYKNLSKTLTRNDSEEEDDGEEESHVDAVEVTFDSK